MKPSAWDDEPAAGRVDEVKPLSAQEAQALRLRQPNTSLARVVLAQVVVGLSVSVVAYVITGRLPVFWSALYGAVLVAVPSALFARGLWRMRSLKNPVASAIGLGLWEGFKLFTSLLGLVAAPWVVPQISWPAMLAGLLLTIKVYWVALAWQRMFAPI